MINLRKADARGHFNFGWLKTYHTFSFGEYYDPNLMGFRDLRVINEDWVQAGGGFPTHPHREMEIITYVLEGSLAHKDSMGNGSTIKPGEVQRMSAGTGITHSEFNHSPDSLVHLLQIWILPDRRGVKPSYEQKMFQPEEKRGKLKLIASPDGRNGSVSMNQAVDLYATLLEPGQQVIHRLKPGRHAWVQVARGSVVVNGQQLGQSDAAAISAESAVTITGESPAEVLLFDLA